MEVIEKRQGLKVACLEGIAYRNGWISEEKMRELAKPMLKNQYGQYLLKVIDEMKEEISRANLQRYYPSRLQYNVYGLNIHSFLLWLVSRESLNVINTVFYLKTHFGLSLGMELVIFFS